jgi:hypothetical protein
MTIVEDFRNDHQRVLDRLVDGELGQAERRDLLAALDDEPGGWRSCALAFLEAQTWRWQLSRLAAEQSLRKAESVVASAGEQQHSRSARTGGWWSVCLAVAACLLVAFGLGTRFPTTGGSPTTSAVGGVASQPHVAAETQVATVPSTDGETLPEDPDLRRRGRVAAPCRCGDSGGDGSVDLWRDVAGRPRPR